MHEAHQVAAEGQQNLKPKEQGHQRRVKNGFYHHLQAHRQKILLLFYLNHLKKSKEYWT